MTLPGGCARLIVPLALFGSGPATASDREAENHLVDAAGAYRLGAFDEALSSLRKARAEVESSELAAKIVRQEGILFSATGRPVDALASFRDALALNPLLELGAYPFGPDVRSLFDCATKLPPSAPKVSRLKRSEEGSYLCPVGQVREAPPLPEAKRPEPRVREVLEAPRGGFDGRTPGWVLLGTSVAAGIGAGVTFALAESRRADADNAQTIDALEDAQDDVDRFRTVGAILAGSAGLFAAASLVLHLLHRDEETPAAQVSFDGEAALLFVQGTL